MEHVRTVNQSVMTIADCLMIQGITVMLVHQYHHNTAQAAQKQTPAAAYYSWGVNIKQKKSQVSLETLSAVGMILIIFMFMSFFAYRINSDKFSAEERSLTENQCLRISNIISGIYLSNPGAEFNITLEYNTTFESGTGIFVKSENKESFCLNKIAFTNSTDNMFKFAKKTNTSFRNVDGAVLIRG